MVYSIVKLPADAGDDFEVYVNGVAQREEIDYTREGRELIFGRPLRKDRISRWRWLLGAWGVGTYRQDDTVDIRYEVDGEIKLKHEVPVALASEPGDDD